MWELYYIREFNKREFSYVLESQVGKPGFCYVMENPFTIKKNAPKRSDYLIV